MYIDFSKIKLKDDGVPERPVLRLQTLTGEIIGVIANEYNLEFEINYSSLSQIRFDISKWHDGKENPIYDKLTGYKVIYTDALGIYVLIRPEITGNGFSEVKHVTGYSIEQLREGKKLYLEEGVYNFWSYSPDQETILCRILELFPGWSAGTIDSKFIGMYRKFDQYDKDVLQFCYNDASDIYRCVFVFDVYQKKINVYSADESRGTLPIYLGYENLVKEANVVELSDEIKTKIHVYGDDGLDITGCNPTGTDYLVDLSWFIENGDLEIPIADIPGNEFPNRIVDIEVGGIVVTTGKEVANPKRMRTGYHKLGRVKIIWPSSDAIQYTIIYYNGSKQVIENTAWLRGSRTVSANDVDGAVYVRFIFRHETNSGYDFNVAGALLPDGCSMWRSEEGSATLADKYRAWQDALKSVQNIYTTLASSRSSVNAAIMTQEAEAQVLSSEVEVLSTEQSAIIQEIALAKDETEKGSKETSLANKTNEISTKKGELSNKENEIAAMRSNANLYLAHMKSITDSFSMEGYFTRAEMAILEEFLQEENLSEETFVATDVAAARKGNISKFNGTVQIKDCDIKMVDVEHPQAKRIFSFSKGTVVANNAATDGDGNSLFSINPGHIIRGTLEVMSGDESCVLSLYLANASCGNELYNGGSLTIRGNVSSFSGNITATEINGVTENIGSQLSFNIQQRSEKDKANLMFSESVTEYQKHAVVQSLYDFGVEALRDMAYPTYEFSIDSSNFLFLQEFNPFKDYLELGKAAYVSLSNGQIISANIIGLNFGYDDKPSLSLTFSNRFKKRDGIVTLEGMIKSSYSSASRFDASRFKYEQVAKQQTYVNDWMRSALNTAVTKIVGASNQSVIIDGAGIHVIDGTEDNTLHQIRIVNDMIAITDDGWQSAKLAIGRFAGPSGNEVYGVNAEVLAGNLIIGNSMILQSEGSREVGEGQTVKDFRFDETGAWLNNATFTMQGDSGGKILIDPRWGIAAGTGNLYTIEGTEVKPTFLDENNEIQFDTDGMPTYTNFFLNLNDGYSYFKGTVNASSGKIGGWVIESGKLSSGSGDKYVAMSSSDGDYALWAGDTNAAASSFSVTREGVLKATGADITGSMNSTSGTIGGWTIKENILEAKKIDSNNNAVYVALGGASGSYSDYAIWAGAEVPTSANFYVKKNGEIVAKNGTFTGKIEAAEIIGTLSAGAGTDAGWLEGCGIRVGKKDGTTGENASAYSFYVDKNGNLTLAGDINLSGGKITWGNNLAKDLPQYMKDKTNENKIHATNITSAYIETPCINLGDDGLLESGRIQGTTITGGVFYATGQGRINPEGSSKERNPAYYICSGYSETSTDVGGKTYKAMVKTPNVPLGWICYDEKATSEHNDWESDYRIIVKSINYSEWGNIAQEPNQPAYVGESVPLKIWSGGNLSLTCGDVRKENPEYSSDPDANPKYLVEPGRIFLDSPVVLTSSQYGTTLPAKGAHGQMFFKKEISSDNKSRIVPHIFDGSDGWISTAYYTTGG